MGLSPANSLPRKQTQMELVVSAMETNISRLNATLGRLSDKLSPVLRSKIPSASSSDEAEDVEEIVGLARVFRDYALNIGRLADEVDDMVNRLEL